MDLSDWSPRSVIADVTQARTQASNALVRTSIASKLSKFKLPRWDARAPTVSFTLDGALQLVDYIIETPPGIEPERKTHIAKFMSDPNGLNGALARNPNYLQNGAKGIATCKFDPTRMRQYRLDLTRCIPVQRSRCRFDKRISGSGHEQ